MKSMYRQYKQNIIGFVEIQSKKLVINAKNLSFLTNGTGIALYRGEVID